MLVNGMTSIHIFANWYLDFIERGLGGKHISEHICDNIYMELKGPLSDIVGETRRFIMDENNYEKFKRRSKR